MRDLDIVAACALDSLPLLFAEKLVGVNQVDEGFKVRARELEGSFPVERGSFQDQFSEVVVCCKIPSRDRYQYPQLTSGQETSAPHIDGSQVLK